jgi:2-dehydro-3-deoxyphosphogluconate aldolase/(4S)-4-hydroxy-2-oxoglutarate aldolase
MAMTRSRSETLPQLMAAGLVPVVRAESSDIALRVTEALVSGGVAAIEITMTVPGALDVIRAIVARFGADVLVGAGTVTEVAMLDGALDAGAQFIVSPAVVPGVVTAAHARDVTVLPGALTPTEVLMAWQLGGDIIKIFPASHVGGASYLKALKGPFPHIRFCPTGGVTLDTIEAFVRAGAVAVGVGGELVSRAAIDAGDYARITTLAQQFVSALARARAGG